MVIELKGLLKQAAPLICVARLLDGYSLLLLPTLVRSLIHLHANVPEHALR